MRDTEALQEDIIKGSPTPDPEVYLEALLRAYNRFPLDTGLNPGDVLQVNAAGDGYTKIAGTKGEGKIPVVQPDGTVAWGNGASLTGAILETTTTQSIPDAAVTPVNLATELKDTDGFHSGTDATVTIPAGQGGEYRVTGRLRYAGNATGSNRQVRIEVNGTTVALGKGIVSSLEALAETTVDLVLAAGDVVELNAYQDSGGALDVGGANYRRSFLSVVQLGKS